MTAATATGLNSVLAAEHAAIDGYAAAGAALVGLQAPLPLLAATRGGYDALRQSRDQFNDAVDAAGGDPIEALAAYALPFPLTGVAAVVRLLTGLEDRLCGVAASAVGAVEPGGDRLLVADVLGAAALRAIRLRLLTGSPAASAVRAFPGLTR